MSHQRFQPFKKKLKKKKKKKPHLKRVIKHHQRVLGKLEE
jgi:flagellar motor component MotA